MLNHNGGGIGGGRPRPRPRGDGRRRLPTDCFAARPTINPTDTFRHIALARGAAADFALKPPHDIAGQPVGAYLPAGPGGEWLGRLQRAAGNVLATHPVNIKRAGAGRMPANAVWFWGAGEACRLEDFTKEYGVGGTVVTAVPLVKGIALLGGLKAPQVPAPPAFWTPTMKTRWRRRWTPLRAAMILCWCTSRRPMR